MTQIIYLMNTTILMSFKRLERFLMSIETNEIRKKLYKKEGVYNFLKEKEQNDSTTNSEKKA